MMADPDISAPPALLPPEDLVAEAWILEPPAPHEIPGILRDEAGLLLALRSLAERRGYRGYSRVLAEAVDEYVVRHAGEAGEERAARIARLEGSLSDADARAMREVIRAMRPPAAPSAVRTCTSRGSASPSTRRS